MFTLFRSSILASLLLVTVSMQVHAEKADRGKPVNIEADRGSADDRNKVQTFEGRVILTQGTLRITADKLVVTQDADGYQKGVATGGEGGLARFRQKKEGKDEYMEGEAERIEYAGRSDKVKLFQRAIARSGQDEIRSQYIEYDGYTELYTYTNGSNATSSKDSKERVNVTIVPKDAKATTPVSISNAPHP